MSTQRHTPGAVVKYTPLPAGELVQATVWARGPKPASWWVRPEGQNRAVLVGYRRAAGGGVALLQLPE